MRRLLLLAAALLLVRLARGEPLEPPPESPEGEDYTVEPADSALGGDFCVATHHWEVDARMKDVLARVLDRAASIPGNRFVRADQLFDSRSETPMRAAR